MADNSNLTMETNQQQPANETEQIDSSATLEYFKILLKLSDGFYFPDTYGAVSPRPEMQNPQLMTTFHQRLVESDNAELRRYALMLRYDRPKSSGVKLMVARLNYADAAVQLIAIEQQHQQRISALSRMCHHVSEVLERISKVEGLAGNPKRLEELFPGGQAFLINRAELLKCHKRQAEQFLEEEKDLAESKVITLRELLSDCYCNRKGWSEDDDPIEAFQNIEDYTEIISQAVQLVMAPACQHERKYAVTEKANLAELDAFLEGDLEIVATGELWSTIKKLLVERGAEECLKKAR